MSVLYVGEPAYTCSHWKLHMKEEFKLERHWLLLTPFKLNAPRLRSRGDTLSLPFYSQNTRNRNALSDSDNVCIKRRTSLGQFSDTCLWQTAAIVAGEKALLWRKKNTCGKGSSLWEPHSTPPLCCVCGTCCRSAEQLNKSYLLLPEGWLGTAGATWYLMSE